MRVCANRPTGNRVAVLSGPTFSGNCVILDDGSYPGPSTIGLNGRVKSLLRKRLGLGSEYKAIQMDKPLLV